MAAAAQHELEDLVRAFKSERCTCHCNGGVFYPDKVTKWLRAKDPDFFTEKLCRGFEQNVLTEHKDGSVSETNFTRWLVKVLPDERRKAEQRDAHFMATSP